jgi:hypothetical protein
MQPPTQVIMLQFLLQRNTFLSWNKQARDWIQLLISVIYSYYLQQDLIWSQASDFALTNI